MSHPFTSQPKAFLLYSLIWLLVIIVNFFILYLIRDFSFGIAISEALVDNLLFALIGLVIWYPTRYIPFRKEAPFFSVLTHLMAGLILILIWLFISVGILGTIHASDKMYTAYLQTTMFGRGVIGSMIYLVLILVYYLVSYARSLKERAMAEEKLRTLVKESELNLLKSQINPHFLFNSLNSISSLIMSNPSEAQEMIVKLSDFLRYSLKHRKTEFVSLEEELVRMKDYLAIEKVRFGEKLKYELKVSDDCNKIAVPTMILQPLIENAIKHGVYESIEPVKVQFSSIKDEGKLILELVNDYDPDQPKKTGTGMGLQNVSDRIRIAYEGKGGITWSVREDKFRVKLFLPVRF